MCRDLNRGFSKLKKRALYQLSYQPLAGIFSLSFKVNLMVVYSEDKFLVTKFEFGGSFGMSLEGDCHEVEVTRNLEL